MRTKLEQMDSCQKQWFGILQTLWATLATDAGPRWHCGEGKEKETNPGNLDIITVFLSEVVLAFRKHSYWLLSTLRKPSRTFGTFFNPTAEMYQILSGTLRLQSQERGSPRQQVCVQLPWILAYLCDRGASDGWRRSIGIGVILVVR